MHNNLYLHTKSHEKSVQNRIREKKAETINRFNAKLKINIKLRWLDNGTSHQKHGFNPGWLHVRFVVNMVSL
jgi:hypothetical protein